eukprot:NODE_24726_length_613_cov_2.818930.p5 GENE.NODE_24726_length_613_cov_2.818930~~NODE_24726_length_613_cov_2.818930.p5  ORF type:complete len:53 (-),score=1.09 NODE_24726_length_613_cov_2.818930:306-464(-)
MSMDNDESRCTAPGGELGVVLFNGRSGRRPSSGQNKKGAGALCEPRPPRPKT